MRHTQKSMSKEDQGIVVGPPLLGGDDWDFTPRAADGLDAANLEILADPVQISSGEDESEEAPAGSAEEE